MEDGRIKTPINIREGGEPIILCGADRYGMPLVDSGIHLVALHGSGDKKRSLQGTYFGDLNMYTTSVLEKPGFEELRHNVYEVIGSSKSKPQTTEVVLARRPIILYDHVENGSSLLFFGRKRVPISDYIVQVYYLGDMELMEYDRDTAPEGGRVHGQFLEMVEFLEEREKAKNSEKRRRREAKTEKSPDVIAFPSLGGIECRLEDYAA